MNFLYFSLPFLRPGRLHSLAEICYLDCKLFRSTGALEHRLAKILTNQNAKYRYETLQGDWLKVRKDGGSPVLPKNLQSTIFSWIKTKLMCILPPPDCDRVNLGRYLKI